MSGRAARPEPAAPYSSIATARSSRRSGYLDRARTRRAVPVEHRRPIPRAQPRGPAGRDGDQPVGRGARVSSPRRWSTRCTGTSPALLEAGGASIDAYYYCPHHPDGTVAGTRAPATAASRGRGLVDRAARDSASIRARSFAVGDRWLDVGLARTVGARGMLVRTGYGAARKRSLGEGLAADAVVDNLARRRRLDSAESVSIDDTESSITNRDHDADCPLSSSAARRGRAQGAPAVASSTASRAAACSSSATSIADEFIYGEVARVSREAPVLILKYDATEMVAGGAGNAANNVAALGGRAALAGLVGADAEGRRLLASFHRGVDRGGVVRARATTARRSRRASWPAAFTRRSSRSSASTAKRAGRSATTSSRAFGGKARAGARRLRRGRAVGLRIGPRHAGAGVDAMRRRLARAVAPASGAGARRQPVPAARLPRPHDVHAERVGGRAGAGRSRSTTIRTRSSGRGGRC